MNVFTLLGPALAGMGLLLWTGCASHPVVEAVALADEFTPSRIFSDHLVLQRDRPIVIFGEATPGCALELTFDRETRVAVAGPDGRWRAEFSPRPAGGPYTLEIRGRNRTERYLDVMVGEVWFCSGQSNMGMHVGSAANAETEVRNSTNPNLRLFTADRLISPLPHTELMRIPSWKPATPSSVYGFSATGYFFGRELQRALGVPVGIINSSWGGTAIETWLPPELPTNAAPAALAAYREQSETYLRDFRAALKRMFELEREVNHPELAALAAPGLDDRDWKTARLPGQWEKSILPGFDGMVAFRRPLELPADWAGRELELELGAIDEVDRTYFNGVEIARRGSSERSEVDYWNRPRYYRVPGELVRAGRNVITVFVSDLTGEGGLWGQAPMRINPFGAPGMTLALEGDWKYQVVVQVPELPTLNGKTFATAYNGMVTPFFEFPVRGCVWYQGESNTQRARTYARQLPQLIADWREHWGEPELPFLIVQLPNYTRQRRAEGPSPWAEFREVQRRVTAATPGAELVVTIDIGEADDIHPKNKQELGRRLALLARNKVYGRPVVAEGPRATGAEFKGDRVVISFQPSASPLRAVSPLLGFELAGKDGKFHPAHAEIAGAQVVVTAPEVPAPTAVRYAWAENPECNLTNQAGLPAAPFRFPEQP